MAPLVMKNRSAEAKKLVSLVAKNFKVENNSRVSLYLEVYLWT